MRALITGAAGGIGLAVAERLTERAGERGEPAALVLVDLDAERLAAAAASLRQLGATVETSAGDLGDPAFAERAVAVAAERLGGLDALVSNAGAIGNDLLVDLSVEDFDLGFAINTRATWLLAKYAHPMLRDSRGAVVATASISGIHPTPPHGSYSASKAALIMLIAQLAFEWGPDGIRCNCVSPGHTHTPMTDSVYSDPERRRQRASRIPLRRVAEPREIAAAAVFLLSEEAGYVTGVNLPVDGGLGTSLMPAIRGLDEL